MASQSFVYIVINIVLISVTAQFKGCTDLHRSNAATFAYVCVFLILCTYSLPTSPAE